MGIEFRITKGPQRASGTTPATGVIYTAIQSMATKDVIPVLDFSKIEVVLQVFNLETNTASVQVSLETSMQEESDNSSAWLTVFSSGIISIPGRTFGVTAPATPSSPTLLKYLRWTVVLTGTANSQAVAATFELQGVARLG